MLEVKETSLSFFAEVIDLRIYTVYLRILQKIFYDSDFYIKSYAKDVLFI